MLLGTKLSTRAQTFSLNTAGSAAQALSFTVARSDSHHSTHPLQNPWGSLSWILFSERTCNTLVPGREEPKIWSTILRSASDAPRPNVSDETHSCEGHRWGVVIRRWTSFCSIPAECH